MSNSISHVARSWIPMTLVASLTVIAPATAQERVLRAELELDASVDVVWSLWTTGEGIRSFFAKDARVEPRVDGNYDYFDQAWNGFVLPMLQHRAANGPVNWAQPPPVKPLRPTLKLTLAAPMSAAGQQDLDARAAFERLKVLAGTWDATEKGNPAFAEVVTYTMTGRGSVLMEDMQAPASSMGHMLTAYHLDKGQLVLTHFCGAGNQPRMRAKTVDEGGRRISFEMYDITNLTNPEAYHSTRVDVVFLSDDRVDLVYRGAAAGKETTQVFQLARRKL